MRISEATLKSLDDVAAWQSSNPRSEPITLLDYVGFVATPDTFFAFADLYSPSLVVHAGYRFVASRFSVDTYDAWVRTGTPLLDIQRVLNHVHISTLIQNIEVSDHVAVEAARVLGELWQRTLGPHGLEVGVSGTTLDDAQVTFWESQPP
ncbi:MAG: hypothetical protein Q8Q09_28620 [Deltaproteobacteria bacterium]|nr:hypothetical protein [Deltaproteobacteria bacterium]